MATSIQDEPQGADDDLSEDQAERERRLQEEDDALQDELRTMKQHRAEGNCDPPPSYWGLPDDE